MVGRFLPAGFLICGLLQVGEPRAGDTRPAVAQAVSQAQQGQGGSQVQPLKSIPAAALNVLKGDETVRSCLDKRQMSSDQLPASWFSASQIHLSGAEQDDLLVQPISSPERAGCFHGVDCCAWFWVFRQVGKRYELVLKVFAGALSVRDTTSKGYRDIEVASGNAKGYATMTFRFDGLRYKQFRKRTTYRDQ